MSGDTKASRDDIIVAVASAAKNVIDARQAYERAVRYHERMKITLDLMDEDR